MVLNCKPVEDYVSYLKVIKGRSIHTINEYQTDLRMLFMFVYEQRNPNSIAASDCSFADIEFIKSITVDEIYSFIAYCQNNRNCSIQTCGRKLITFRQFWRHLKNKAHLINDSISEELELPQLPKRIVKYLDLEDSMRLLIETEDSPRNYCIITLFLNCALRVSELVNLDMNDMDSDKITVIGKGNKQRQIYLNHAAMGAITDWLSDRESYNPKDNALFVSKNGTRLTTRSVQLLIRKAIKKAGLSDGITPHKLRHTAATLLYKHGHVDIRSLQEILGHSTISSTEIYTHVDSQQLQAAINANPLAGVSNRSHRYTSTYK